MSLQRKIIKVFFILLFLGGLLGLAPTLSPHADGSIGVNSQVGSNQNGSGPHPAVGYFDIHGFALTDSGSPQ